MKTIKLYSQTALKKPTKFCMTLPMTKWTGLQLRPILGPNQAKRPGVQGQLELCLLPRKGANLWPWEAFQARNIRCKFCGSIPTIPIEKLSLTASYVQISYSYNPFYGNILRAIIGHLRANFKCQNGSKRALKGDQTKGFWCPFGGPFGVLFGSFRAFQGSLMVFSQECSEKNILNQLVVRVIAALCFLIRKQTKVQQSLGFHFAMGKSKHG